MKKLLLITAASTAILSSAAIFAATDPCEGVVMNAPMTDSAMNSSMPASAMENLWYLKVDAGAVIFDSQKDKFTGIKMKSNTGFTGEIGAGYYIMDNLRTDFTVGLVTSNHLKKSANDKADNRGSVKHRPNIVSFLLNGYVDVVDLNMFKVFAGAGIGAAMVKEKISYTYADATIGSGKVNVKNKTNFAYQLSLGTSFEVAQGVKAELVYSWRDYGKTKTKTITKGSDSARFGGTRYRGSNLMAGLRFDM
ncbi:outer membrane protein [Rickettsia endosymbiont of Pantilius tunicatus]|uniref:outer membrane protein n=1 Tax=Rickettsia endosymbiont of Pantilius tunicatus TaxID=3066267 RepID=UPI0030E28A08